VDVSVQLGGQTSGSQLLSVEAASDVLDLAVGSAMTVTIGDSPSCMRLAEGNWLAMVQSVSSIGAARFDYRLTGLRKEEIVSADQSGLPAR